MKFSNKSLIVVLVVLVAVFWLLQIMSNEGKSKSLRSELVNYDVSEITKLMVQTLDDTVLLEKNNEQWHLILKGEKKKVLDESVDQVLTALLELKPDRLVARSKDSWKEYQLDSTGMRVLLHSGNDIITDIVLGKFKTEGQRSISTFVRLSDEENVYAAKNFLKMNIYSEPDDYRNDKLFSMSNDSITQIQVTTMEDSFTLLNAEGKWSLEGQSVDSALMATYFNSISQLSSSAFFDEEIPSVAPQQKMAFSFSNRENVNLEIFERLGMPVIKSSENTYELFSDSSIVNKIVKDRSYFLK